MKLISLFLILLFSFQLSTAQNTIKVSTKKVTHNGKLYYIHKVKKGETLYAIAKAYNVQVNDIVFENPDVFDGIKAGLELKIPIKEIYEGEYIKHLVMKGETIYSICRNYGITQNELKTINPLIKEKGLQAGTYIKIKKRKSSLNYHQFKTKTVNKTNNDTGLFIYHTVKAKETLYSLSNQFNISINEILKNNPDISQNGLKKGQIIKIPKKQKTQEPLTLSVTRPSADSLHTKYDSLMYIIDTVFSKCQTTNYVYPEANILLVLPFQKNNFKVPANYDFDNISNYKTFPFVEFYEGLLLALDTLRKQGININLKVADSNDSLTIKNYLDSGWQPNLYIGSTSTKVFNFIYRWRNKDIVFIDPFKSKQKIYSNRIFYTLPSLETQINALKSFILSLDTVNLIIPFSTFANDRKIEDTIYNDIYNSSIIENKDFLIKKINLKNGDVKEIENMLSVGRKNIILYLSTDEPEVNTFLSKLRLLTKDYNISVIGHPIWRNFQLNYEYLHRLQTYLVSPNFLNYETDTIHQFIMKFKKYYKKMPSKFAYWGYDITWYFSKALCYFGTDFFRCLPSFHPTLFISSFYFEQNETGSFQNKGNFIIHYSDDFKQIGFPLN